MRRCELTVGLVTFNSRRTLELTIDSLVRQTLPHADWTLIVVDNGSTDGTVELARKALEPARFTWSILERSSNHVALARQDVIDRSLSPFVAFVDSDVEIGDDWLARSLTLLKARAPSGCAGVAGPGLLRGGSAPSDLAPVLSCFSKSILGHFGSEQMKSPRSEIKARHLPCSAAIFRRDALSQVGFSAEFKRTGEDVDLSWRLLDQGFHLIFSSELAYIHRTRTASCREWWSRIHGFGAGQISLARRHPARAISWRLFLPLLYLPWLMGSFASLFWGEWIIASGVMAYVLCAGFESARIAPNGRRAQTLYLMLVTHLAYSTGQWRAALARRPHANL